MPEKKKFRFSITFVILIILLSSIVIVNIYLDRVVLRNIVPSVENFLDKKIEISGISLGPYGIKIYGVNISDESNKEIFTCDKIYIYFQLKPLLDKEFIIDHIRLIKPKTSVYHHSDGQWVSPLFIETKGAQKGKIKIELKKVSLENGEVEVIDDKTVPSLTTRLKNVKGYFSLGKKLNYDINGYPEDDKGKIRILGSIESGTGIYKVHFTGENLDAVRFNPYYREYFNYPVDAGIVTNISLTLTGDNKTYRNRGEINFKNLDFKYFAGQRPVHAVNGKIVFTSSPNIVILEDISGVINECESFKVSGRVWPAVGGKDKYELLLNLENLDFPLAKKRYIQQEGLKRDLNIQGKGRLVFRLLVDGDNFQYIGETDLKNAEVDWGKVLFKPKDKICSLIFNINYKKDEKVFGDFKFVSKPVVVEGKGEIVELTNQEPKSDIHLSLTEGNIEELLAFLPPWPKEIKLFGETSKVEVRIFTPGNKTIYSVHINGTPLRWEYAKLFNKPFGMESDIEFDLVPEKDKLLLVNPRLTFGDSEVTTKIVEIDLKDERGLIMDLDFKRLVYDDARKISNFFKEENIKLDGFCSTRFILNSSKEETSLEGGADIFGTRLEYKNFLTKETGVSGDLQFNISWKGNIFAIKKLELDSNKNKFLLNGEIADYDKEQPQYNLTVSSDSFYWNTLVPGYIPGLEDYKLLGNSSIKLNISGQKKFLNLKGELDLTKCNTYWKELFKKPKNINHKINFEFLLGQSNFIINKINVLLGDIRVTGEGKVENYRTENKKLILNWQTEDFSGSKLINFMALSDWLESLEIKGLLTAETSVFKEENLEKIKGKFNLNNVDIFLKGRSYKANSASDNFTYTVNAGEDVIYIDSGQYTIGQTVFKIKGKIAKEDDNLKLDLDAASDKLFLKEIIPFFSPKMAGELDGLTIGGASKININLKNDGKSLSWQGDIDLKENYFSYKEIIAKPENMDSRIIFKIFTQDDSINFDTLSFVWNNSRVDFYGKINNMTTEPVLDLSLTGNIFYPELKMIVVDNPEGQNIIKKFFTLRDENEKINLNLKITGKIENPEIKSDWGLITAVAIKIGLQNSIDFLEKTTGKTLETTLNFGRKTVETTVLMGGKVLRETVRAGINVIEGVFKIIWPFNKK